MKLDYSSLENAVAQLEECLDYLYSDQAKKDPKAGRIYRTAAIQAFEFTYSLAAKMIVRQLEQIVPDPTALSRNEFSGFAADCGGRRNNPGSAAVR